MLPQSIPRPILLHKEGLFKTKVTSNLSLESSVDFVPFSEKSPVTIGKASIITIVKIFSPRNARMLVKTITTCRALVRNIKVWVLAGELVTLKPCFDGFQSQITYINIQ